MAYENLIVEVRPPIAVLTLHRPKVLNAMNAATFSELEHAFTALASDASIRAILVTGAGERAFAAGADIGELAAVSTEAGQAFALRGQSILRRIETLDKPVIACIRGFALGGGCELAMACTLRITAEDARLGLPEVKLGVIPGYGGTQRLPRIVGRSAALKLLLTGAMIDAREALRIGLVDEVVPAAQLMTRAEEIATSIAANAPLAVTEALHSVDEGIDLPLDLALQRESERFGRLCATADKEEGARAFLEKRPPQWTGR